MTDGQITITMEQRQKTDPELIQDTVQQAAGRFRVMATSPVIRKSTTSLCASSTAYGQIEKQTPAVIRRRYGGSEGFLMKVTPMTQTYFARQPEMAVMGSFPTLKEIRAAYGKDFEVEWLVPQLADMSVFTGAKNITEMQQESLARMMAVEYGGLKVTEVLLFFHRFKSGHYGKFYGSVDPMTVMMAIGEFMKEREKIKQKEEEKMRAAEEERIREAWRGMVDVVQQQTGLRGGDIWLDVVDLHRMKVRMSVIDRETMEKVMKKETRGRLLKVLRERIGEGMEYAVYLNVGGGEERKIEEEEEGGEGPAEEPLGAEREDPAGKPLGARKGGLP